MRVSDMKLNYAARSGVENRSVHMQCISTEPTRHVKPLRRGFLLCHLKKYYLFHIRQDYHSLRVSYNYTIISIIYILLFFID